MIKLPFQLIQSYRAQTFRISPGQNMKSKEEAIAFVKERGFVYFWPITGILLPSLWVAVAGDRPVADQHDDPGHITWEWKDSMLGGRAWYYAKILRKKATMIDFSITPYFYALSENYGLPEEDYLTLYEQGRMTQEAKSMYEALLQQGPLDTVALRRATRMTSQTSDSRFNRALADLQADFKILPIAVTESGAWHYAFSYEITARHYPDLPEIAQEIRESDAREKIILIYFQSVGAAQIRDLIKLFQWKPTRIERAIEHLIHIGLIQRVVFEDMTGEWLMLRELF